MSDSARPISPAPASRPFPGARTAWLVLAALLLFSIAAPLNQFKVPPLLPVLMQVLNLSVGRAGLLMSVYAITGLVLAIPAGFICQRAGFRLTGLIAGGSIVLGAVLGAVSANLGLLLVSRVIEGIGTSFIAVLAPAVIAQAFAAHRRGIAMGIWANWVPLGSLAMLVLAPSIAGAGNWPAVWWFGALYALVVTGLFLLTVRQPAPAAAGAPPSGAGDFGRVMGNRNLWLLSLAFAFLNMAFMGAGTYLPTYLGLVRGLPLAQAAPLASLGSVTAIVAAPLAGLWSDRLGSRKWPYLVGFVLTACVLPLPLFVTGGALVALILVQGVFSSLIPTNIFSAAVEAVGDERLGGLAMGVIMVGQNAGQLAGPIVFGALAESAGGWPLAFGSLAGMCLLAALAGGLVREKRR